MPPHDLIEVLRRLHEEAEELLVESPGERQSREEDAAFDQRFRTGLDACEEVLIELCLEFKAHLLRESKELREALAGGADIRDRRGRGAVPLGPASIRKVLGGLAAILNDAVEDGHIEHNPARGKRMRVHVPRPRRSFLEMDELAALLDAAASQDVPLPADGAPIGLGPTAAVVEHIDRLRRMGAPTGAEDYLVPNLHGGRLNRQRVGQIVAQAAELASERLVERGLPPLPNTTPHALRRTYISIALLANNFDVKWVMGVGHADSKMTMDVYAQLEQRVDRGHGTSFDRLINTAREQVAGLPNGLDSAPNAQRLGDEAPKIDPPGPPQRLGKRDDLGGFWP